MMLEHLTVEFDSTDRSHPRFLVSTARTGHIAAVHEEHGGRWSTSEPTWIVRWRQDISQRATTRYHFRFGTLKAALDACADAVNRGIARAEVSA